jgi:hypothetical protein
MTRWKQWVASDFVIETAKGCRSRYQWAMAV